MMRGRNDEPASCSDRRSSSASNRTDVANTFVWNSFVYADVGQVEASEAAVVSSKPGRYHVDQIERGPILAGHASRRWGVAIKHPDGRVILEPDPWPE